MRKQRPRGTVTRQAVVDAALSVADQVGIKALTIRAVAKGVDAPPMSLYVHFASKEELLDLMYVEVSRRMYLDQGNSDWRIELHALCLRIRRVLLEHPEWAPLLTRATSPFPIPLRERLLNMMMSEGMPAASAFDLLAGAALMAMGVANMEMNWQKADGPDSLERRYQRLKQWAEEAKQDGAASVHDSITERPSMDMDRVFDATVSALIAGWKPAQPAQQ